MVTNTRIKSDEELNGVVERLKIYKIMKLRMECDILDLEDLRLEDPLPRSDDAEENDESKIRTLEHRIAKSQNEIKRIDVALNMICEDEYYPLFYDIYIKGKSGRSAAMNFGCSEAASRYNAKRMLSIIARILNRPAKQSELFNCVH